MRSLEALGGLLRAVLIPLVLLPVGTAAIAEERVIPAGWEPEILRLIDPLEPGGSVAEGYRIEGIGAASGAFVFQLGGEGRVPWSLRLVPTATAPGYELKVDPPPAELDAKAVAALDRLRSILVSRLDSSFWSRVTVAVEATSPSRIQQGFPALQWVALVAAAMALVLLERSRRRGIGWAAAAAATGVVPLIAWYWSWPLDGSEAGRYEVELWLQERERSLVQISLAIALAGLALTSSRVLSRLVRSPDVLLGAGFVLAWSMAVRFGMTVANILTDGGSGWSRLLEYRRGFSGVAVLVDLVFPDRSMWDSIFVPRLLAALSPPILVLVAWALGAKRRTAVLAGLALACLPLHAALYSSDFESGAVVTLQLAAVALLAAGVRAASALAVASGLALAAYALWGRPEAVIVGAPIAGLLCLMPRRLWNRPLVWAGAAWLLGVAAVRLSSLPTRLDTLQGYLAGPWGMLPYGDLMTTSAIMPFWLWLPLPFGILWLPGRARLIAILGLIAGLVPIHLTPTMYDPTETYLEFFRYGSFTLPWLALVSAAGIMGLASYFSRVLAIPSIAGFVALGAGLMMLATPMLNLDYLGRHYGPAIDEQVYREALTQIAPECEVIVPDDDKALDVLKRYFEITREVFEERRDTPPPHRVVGLSTFLGRSEPLEACSYFYRGTHCHDGFDGQPPEECRQLLGRYDADPVWSRDVEYRSHRLVSRPGRKVSPWYEPSLTLTLFRLRRAGRS